MKCHTRLITLFLVICFQAYSQSDNDSKNSSKLELIDSIKEYCINELNMDISKNFYSKWEEIDKPNYYLYVSEKDTLMSALNKQEVFSYFGRDFKRAKKEKDYYNRLGYATLLYETYGTAATRLSNHLLSYSKESIAFIAFHEATHQHIRNKAKVPYSIIESVCDVVGNYGTLSLFSERKDLRKRKAKKQINQIEGISSEINSLINDVEFQNTIDLKIDTTALIKRIRKLNKKRNRFKIERYDYEINHAYLLRNRNYTKYYFKLKTLLILTNDLKEFINIITKLPSGESDCITEIENIIRTLTKSDS